MKNYTTALVILFSFTCWLTAAGSLGQSGGNFLQISPEARGASLGGAIPAAASGASALYWNPAGILQNKKTAFIMAHTDWFMDTHLSFGGLVYKMDEQNALGLSVLHFGMDDTEITTVFEPDGSGDYYQVSDLAVGFSYTRAMSDRFTVGLTGKYIRETIWNEDADQYALDVGSLYSADFRNLRLGMSVRNLSGKLEYSGDDIDDRLNEEQALEEENNPRIERLTPGFRLPQVFNFGVAFVPVDLPTGILTVMTSVDVPSDNEERMILAAEYDLAGVAFLRGSLVSHDDTRSFALGAGVQVPYSVGKCGLDYSYSAHEYFGDVHRFSIILGI